MRRSPVIAAALLLAGSAAAAAPAAPTSSSGRATPPPAVADSVVAFVDVTVIPMDRERVLERQTVIVQGGRITALGPTARTRVPAGALRVDGRGKYLMPGLAEMHAHVLPPQAPGNADESVNKDIFFLYIANGITSIRAMLGAPNQLVLRRQLQSGELLGPTMYVSAPSLNANSAPNPDTAAKLVRAHKAAGYDFLKIHPFVTQQGPMPQPLARAVYDTIAATARAVGITWAGHVPQQVGLRRAIDAGQATVDHLDQYLEATLPDSILQRIQAAQPGQPNPVGFAQMVGSVDAARFAAVAQQLKAAGVWSIPTVFVWENLFGQGEEPEAMGQRPETRYWPKNQVANWVTAKRTQRQNQQNAGVTPELARRFLSLRRDMLKALTDAGAPVLMGTDSPQLFMVPGFALHRELAIMAEAGLSPYQIYETGTKNVARYVTESLRQDGKFGTVAVGNRADLVLLDANPLQSVANLTKRSGVMVRGRWIPAAELQRRLDEMAARFAAAQ